MFNTYSGGNSSANVKINACSGGIYKTYPESWFNRFHLKSALAETLFKKENIFYDASSNKYGKSIYDFDSLYREYLKEIIVLQMIICGDMEVIVELINKEDFDKYFENKVKEMK
jgi:hypothetical protein